MKTGELLFWVLCLLLIITSIYHLKLYSSCSNKNSSLRQDLLRKNISNNVLNNKINNLNNKTNNLRTVSAHKVINNRNMAKSSNSLGKKASNLIISLQNKINAHQDLNNSIQNEIESRAIRQQLQEKHESTIRAKTLIPPISEQPYLLIEPQTVT